MNTVYKCCHGFNEVASPETVLFICSHKNKQQKQQLVDNVCCDGPCAYVNVHYWCVCSLATLHLFTVILLARITELLVFWQHEISLHYICDMIVTYVIQYMLLFVVCLQNPLIRSKNLHLNLNSLHQSSLFTPK